MEIGRSSHASNSGAPANGLAGVRVLVVEDDRSIALQLVRGLERAGCQVTTVDTGNKALSAARTTDLIILDLGLPDIDGLDLCVELRSRTPVPIIVVTAREAEAAKVSALDLGADDYLPKPFGFAELMARMRAVLRRADRGPESVVHHGLLTVDLAAHRVQVDGVEIALTAKEFGILACLATDPARVVSREEIFARVWDEHWYGPTRVLDVHLVSLRRKLGDPALVETVYGVGFRLRAP
jgi:DNA-binding response OmpR family regulator